MSEKRLMMDHDVAIRQALADRQAMIDRDNQHAQKIKEIMGYREDIAAGLKDIEKRINTMMGNKGLDRAIYGSTLLIRCSDSVMIYQAVHVIPEAS